MKKTKLFLGATVPLLCVGGLVGCAKKGDDENVIKIAVVSDKGERDIMNLFIAEYQKIPGNENVEFLVDPMTNYDDYIRDAYLYDEVPDIVQVYDYNAEYYTNTVIAGADKLLAPISSYMQRDNVSENDFFPRVLEMAKSGPSGDNQMYWVPRDYNKVVVIFNKKMFDEANEPYPTTYTKEQWTWSKFREVCEHLKAKESDIRTKYSHSSVFFPADMNLNFPAVYYPCLKSFGGELIDKTTETCFGNTQAKVDIAKTAWDVLLSMSDAKLACEPPSNNETPFVSKQAAMYFTVRPNLPTAVTALGGDAIDFVSMPTYEGIGSNTSYIGTGCTGYGLTNSCPDSKKDKAWDFLKFIISKEGQNAFSRSGAGIPSIQSLATSDDAEFKKYISSSLNHEVFVSDQDRDISMNFLKGFHVDKQLKIDKYIKNRTLKEFNKPNEGRDAYFLKYKEKMEEYWK